MRPQPAGRARPGATSAVAVALFLGASCAPVHPSSAPAAGREREAAQGSSDGEGEGAADGSAEQAARSRPTEAELAARYEGKAPLSSQRGEASYYGAAFAGRKTASGETFDPGDFTAAHRTLPFGTIVRVERVDAARSVYVRITDRGPFGGRHRIIDLSHAAAEALGMLRRGVAEVRVEVVELGPRKRTRGSHRRR